MSIFNEFGTLKKVLLCPPNHMKWEPITTVAKKNLEEGKEFDVEVAKKEHENFASAIEDFGVEVLYSKPQPGLGVQVFTRDLGSATPKGVFFGRFKYDVRKPEINLTKKVLRNNNIPIIGEVQEGVLEGGDIHVLDEETLIIGKAERTDDKGIDEAQRILGDEFEIIRLDVDPEFHHTDCVFIILNENLCVACLEALPQEFVDFIKSKGFEILETSLEDARNVRSNMVALDSETILSHKGAKSINEKLKSIGFKVIAPKIDMLTGQGGGPRCLTFPVEREKN